MAIYGLFSWLDYAIYSMVRYIMRLIILVANYNFFGEEKISDLADKVYVVLGVLVLFKIIISCVEFMVNPDTFDDKEKGMAGILKKTAICMVLLVAVRPIFSFAITIQQTVVATIPSLVMGTSGKNFTIDASNAKEELDSIGELIAGTTIRAFVNIKTDEKTKAPVANDTMDSTLASFSENVSKGCDRGGLFEKIFTTNNCYYDYMWGISTAAGIFLLYILTSMTIDIGIRSIKLGIIQILAPIPISSYIVSKDKLNKFFKLAVKVYLDLFIRLIVVYFIIFFVKNVVESMTSSIGVINGYQTEFSEQIFIKVIIIIALFMFAKNAPKFICNVFGLEDNGDFKDMFTRGAGLLGTTAAGLRTARSNYTAQKERAMGKGQKFARLRALKSAAAGLTSATGRGLVMAAQGKGFKDVRMGASKAAIKARTKRNERIDKLNSKRKATGDKIGRIQYRTDAKGDMIGRKFLHFNKLDMGRFGNGLKNWTPTNKFGEMLKKGATMALYQREKNPEYYGWREYRRDVRREKLEIPSNEGFVKVRYDAMDSIAKTAADAKGHGVGKMNETPDKFKISFTDSSGAYKDEAFEAIAKTLGFKELTMEQVRNMYQMAKNGQSISDVKNKPVKLSDKDITALGTLVQNIEKRTSYMKEAELMATGDPAAQPNVDKLVLGLANNKDMFTSPQIMEPIIKKMGKNMDSYRKSHDENSKDYNVVAIEGKEFDISTYTGLVRLTSQLKEPLTEPKPTDEKYVAMRNSGSSEDDIKAALSADRDAFTSQVSVRADILTGLKDSFEEVSKQQYRSAQIADNRAQKAQQAINNNNDKKG